MLCKVNGIGLQLHIPYNLIFTRLWYARVKQGKAYIKLCFSLGQIAIKLGGNIHCWAHNNDEELLSFLYFCCCYTVHQGVLLTRLRKKKTKPTSEKCVKK